MNTIKLKRAKSVEIISKISSSISIKLQNLSLPNILKHKKNEDKEELIGYEIEQTSRNEIINTIKSLQINNANQNNLDKSSFLEYNNCLTNNSKCHKNKLNISINKIDKFIKGGRIFENNKDYNFLQKPKNINDLNNKSYTLNKVNRSNNFLTENNNDLNNISNNNLKYKNLKTYQFKNDDDKKNNDFNTSKKIEFDELSMVSKINSDENLNINITGEEDYFLKENDIENNNLNKYKLIINKIYKEKLELEEKLRHEFLTNKELKNYIEILKQTIENNMIKYGFKDIINNASKELNKNPINFLTEYTKFKEENQKIKKNIIIQQILTTEMKKDIENFKKENDNLKKYKNKNKDNKTNDIININNINGNILNTSNNSEYLDNLSQINKELNKNYINLQNDFNLLSQNNEDIIKYNKKLINENEQFKKEIKYLKEIYIKEKKLLCDRDIENNNNEINELKNTIDNLENLNKELKIKNDIQKNEIENMKDSLNMKINEINKCYKEIENYKNSNYNKINELINDKEIEIFNLKKQNEKIEEMLNEIFDKNISQNISKIKNMYINNKENNYDIDNKLIKYIYENNMNNINNIENKIQILSNFIKLLIEQIIFFDEKLKIQNEMNIKSDIFSDNQKISKEFFNINYKNSEKNEEKENLINFNFNDTIKNSFEEFSDIKQKENQNNSNYDFCVSNNNLNINKDLDDYINIKNKINNIYKSKYENNKNHDDNKEFINFDKTKLFTKKPSLDIKTSKISNNTNNIIVKSFSTRLIKDKNYNNILNQKFQEKDNNKKYLNFRKNEEEKINNIDKIKQKYLNKEENIKTNELFYVTMPPKFTKKQNNLSSFKKNKDQSSKIQFSNITNYLQNALNKNPKYNIVSNTIDSSSRMLTNTFLSINNESSLRSRKKENKTNVNQINKLKNIQKLKIESNKRDRNNLIDEVLKPTFLRSGVSSTFLTYNHNNLISNKNNNIKNLSHLLI